MPARPRHACVRRRSRSERARAQPLLVGVALERERDQPIDQRRIGHAARLPHLRVHADGGEAGDGVDLVHAAARRWSATAGSRRAPCRRRRWRGTPRAPGACTRGGRRRVEVGGHHASATRRRCTSPRSRRTRATAAPRRAARPRARRCRAPRTRSRAPRAPPPRPRPCDRTRTRCRAPRRARPSVFTFEMPTLEPRLAGFTNSGRPSVAQPRRGRGRPPRPLDVRHHGVGRLRQAVGGEQRLHRRLVHARPPRPARRTRRRAPRPARAGPARCRPRRSGPCSTGKTTSRPRPVTTARSGSPSPSSLAGRRSIVTSVSSLGCDTTSVSRPARGSARRVLARLLDHLGGRQRRGGAVGQHPAAVLLDADRHRLVARAIEVLEDRRRRGHATPRVRPTVRRRAPRRAASSRGDNSAALRDCGTGGWRLADCDSRDRPRSHSDRPFSFHVTHTDGAARAGVMTTPHGDGRDAGVHAGRHPGRGEGDDRRARWSDVGARDHPRQHLSPVAAAGRRARSPGAAACTASTAGRGPILTDSGGYQVFSLAERRKVDEAGRALPLAPRRQRAPLLTPERAVDIQALLGSDIAMVLDECPPHPSTREAIRTSLELTTPLGARGAGPGCAAIRAGEPRACRRRPTPARPSSASCRAGCITDLRAESAGAARRDRTSRAMRSAA